MKGKRFGRLTVNDFDHESIRGVPYWLCQCDCGNTKILSGNDLSAGRVKSCGCMPKGREREDLSGRRFGRLSVVSLEYVGDYNEGHWLCECDCGKRIVAIDHNLKRGQTTSCGCRKRERRSEELTDKRFGRLYVLDFDHMGARGMSYWLCECDCGNRTVVSRSSLLSGLTKSCGCLGREGAEPINLAGKRFGNLYVKELERMDRRIGGLWLCECDCGNNTVCRTKELTKGLTTSCGCMDGYSLPRSVSRC